jgi:hypothetical protein
VLPIKAIYGILNYITSILYKLLKYMKNIIILLLLIVIMACSHGKPESNYYIISNVHNHEAGNDSIPPPPPPPPPPGFLAWYYNLVLIFDSTDMVYLYQTECKFKSRASFHYENMGPSFIELNPDHLVTLHASYVKEFLLDNTSFFQLDTSQTDSMRVLYMASVDDTIKNPAFYSVLNLVKATRRHHGFVLNFIRRTTEEENNVLDCKRLNKAYVPDNYKWSSIYLDGLTKPNTFRYDSLENKYGFKIRAQQSFKPGLTIFTRLAAPR